MSPAKRRNGPVRPETWAAVMFGLLGVCAAGAVVLFFLGALSLAGLGGIFLLLLLGALSVLLRYLYNAPPDE
jgi:hypothetical protein